LADAKDAGRLCTEDEAGIWQQRERIGVRGDLKCSVEQGVAGEATLGGSHVCGDGCEDHEESR
jgi:hypothetical protein